MAIFNPPTSMVFWEIWAYGCDVTNYLKDVISSIKVRKIINEMPECEINITSKSYLEDIWVENTPIEIKLGYERLNLTSVFNGIVKRLPSGQAKELLSYRVEGVGLESSLTSEEKTRTFTLPSKRAIIAQIAGENGYAPIIDITDDVIPRAMMPIQRQQTDYEFLYNCAYQWNCVFWFSDMTTISTKALHFYDAEFAHEEGGDRLHMMDQEWRDMYLQFYLGYRSDKAPCNVESISWTWETPKGGGAMTPGVVGANELGRTVDPNSFRVININGQTWELKPELLRRALRDPSLFGTYTIAIALAGVNQSQASLRQYYRIVDYGVTTHADNIPPAHNSAGFKFEITLNEGVPKLKPPRNAFLYCGSMNPMADTADLPNWFFKYGYPAQLKINEVVHTFENGILNTKLGCSMSGIPYSSPHPISSGGARMPRGL